MVITAIKQRKIEFKVRGDEVKRSALPRKVAETR